MTRKLSAGDIIIYVNDDMEHHDLVVIKDVEISSEGKTKIQALNAKIEYVPVEAGRDDIFLANAHERRGFIYGFSRKAKKLRYASLKIMKLWNMTRITKRREVNGNFQRRNENEYQEGNG